jgi:hypothetical protein
MSALYEALQLDVSQLLTDLGQPVTFVRFQTQSDLVEGSVAATAQASQTLPTAVLPVTDTAVHFKDLDLKPLDGTEALTEVKFAVIGAVGASFVPSRGDQALFGGKVWTVLSSTAINLDGVNDVVYIAGLQV